jgi:hypothetical protein
MEDVMKRLVSVVVLLGTWAVPSFGAVTSYQNVPLLDVGCSKKAAANPDAHTRDCAMTCAKSGFGIVTKDQHFLKFDPAGNAKILDELKASSKKDHLRVNVNGDLQGDTLKVTSVTLL